MNQPIFLRTLRSENIFKISDKLKAFQIRPLPTRKIIVKQYECKKTHKNVPIKQIHQQFALTIINDESFVFFQLKQTASHRPSSFTLAERQFMEGGFLKLVVGEMNEISCQEYLISGFRWDGFVIQFVSFSEDLFLFIITNQMISPLVKRVDPKDIQFKIKQGFQELLSRIINQKKAIQLIQIYLEELKRLFQKHPELLAHTQDDDKLINFNLVKYGKISQINSQQVKTKSDEDKRDKSLPAMQI